MDKFEHLFYFWTLIEDPQRLRTWGGGFRGGGQQKGPCENAPKNVTSRLICCLAYTFYCRHTSAWWHVTGGVGGVIGI